MRADQATYDVLEPDLVEVVEGHALDLGGGRVGQSCCSGGLDLAEGRLAGGGHLGDGDARSCEHHSDR